MNALFILPKNWLSFITGILVHLKLPFQLHTIIKMWFIRFYNINTLEAEHSLDYYPTLGDFFTRYLKKGERPLSKRFFVSPCDGTLTRSGALSGRDALIPQIKSRTYRLSKLLGDHWDSAEFAEGFYCVIYLAPFNYHRVHSPLNGLVKSIVHTPGDLWPVNSWSVNKIDGLFWRNERISFEFESENGKLILIMVGATNVGKMSTVLCREIEGNKRGRNKTCKFYTPPKPIWVEKGDEIGCFGMGSTVILIGDKYLHTHLLRCEGPIIQSFQKGPVKMGEAF